MVSIVRAVAGVGGIPAGLPILLDAQMSIVEPAFSYLLELSTIPGRSHSTETLRTYSEHLHDWFDSLEQSGLDWRLVDEGTIAAYRNRMLSDPSPHTGRPYARSTVNDRVRTVCRFYEWARRRGLIESLPFDYVDVSLRSARRQGMLAHLDRRAPVVMANILTVSEAERLPRPLRVEQLQCLFQHLDPPYDLIAEWALATGMRRKELCGLQLHQVPEVAHLSIEQDPLVGVPLTITKGDRPRSVYPPLRLIDRTHWYVGGGSRGLSQAAAQGPTELSRANSAFPQQQGRTCNAGATLRGVWRGFPDGRAGGIGALAAAYVRDDDARALAEASGDNARPQPAEDRAGPARTRLDPVDGNLSALCRASCRHARREPRLSLR